MADDNHPAWETLNRVEQGVFGFLVQMVSGFVEDQEIALFNVIKANRAFVTSPPLNSFIGRNANSFLTPVAPKQVRIWVFVREG